MEKIYNTNINSLVKQITENTDRKNICKNKSFELARLLSRFKFDISEEELYQLKNLANKITLDTESKKLINYIIYNLETRKNNHLLSTKYNYKIISLGSDCLPRTITTRWGLKFPKIMGEPTHPFDLSVHPYEAVCKLIKNNFQDYLNPEFLNHNNQGTPINKKYQVCFNHEKDNSFSEKNFARLINTYERRIKNFYSDIDSYPILFLYKNLYSRNIFPLELAKILQNKFSDVYHKLLCITSVRYSDSDNSELLNNLIIKHINYPYDEYIWHETKHYALEEGKNFELNIINTIKQVIIDYFPLKNSDADTVGKNNLKVIK